MHLTGIKLGNIPPFTDPIRLKFDERVNVFIGPNASGKSTLLQVLAGQLKASFDDSKRSLGDAIFHSYPVKEEELEEFAEGMTGHESQIVLATSEEWPADVPTVHIASVREGLPGISDQPDLKKFGETAEEALDGPFSGSRLICARKLIGESLWSSDDEESIRSRGILIRAIERANSCSKRICDEMIRDSKSHNYIYGPDVRGYLNHPDPHPDRIPILPEMGVNTIEERNFLDMDIWESPSESAYREGEDIPIYLGHLSSGTEGTLLWIRWLALKIAHYYEFEQGWHEKPAILLIDEIENHLHPTWQRRVIPALLEHFPGLQIFATTHSPFVVAGLKAGQVHVLKREEKDGKMVVTASTNERDVVGWSADEILRGMMEVDEPTDQLTVDRAKRLRELREKEVLNEAEETELNQLRRQVNSDFLSKSGPLDAQRERYADMMQDFLRSRQRELNQDGE